MIEQKYFLLNVLLLTFGTIFIRGSFIFLSGKMLISNKVKDLFTYIPAAILPTLIIPATFFHQGKVDLLYGKERFIIMLIAMIVAYFIRNTLFIICFGLALLYFISNS